MRRGPRAAEVLLRAGLVKEDDVQRARRAGGSFVLQVVRGGVAEGDVVAAFGRALRVPSVSLQGKRIDPDVLALVPREVAERYGCLPLFVKDEGGSRVLYLGVEDPTDDAVADDVSFRVGLRVRPVVVGALQLRAALRHAAVPGTPEPVEAPPVRETPVPATDTAPLVADADGVETSEATPALAAEKPRDVPTRDILRAITRLLIDKDVFTRAELLAAVRAVRASDADERA